MRHVTNPTTWGYRTLVEVTSQMDRLEEKMCTQSTRCATEIAANLAKAPLNPPPPLIKKMKEKSTSNSGHYELVKIVFTSVYQTDQ